MARADPSSPWGALIPSDDTEQRGGARAGASPSNLRWLWWWDYGAGAGAGDVVTLREAMPTMGWAGATVRLPKSGALP